MTDIAVTFDPVSFTQLPGWEADDHLAAWKAFVTSCQPVLAAAASGAKSGARPPPQALLGACELALLTARSGPPQTKSGARAFFERHFTPHTVAHTGASGLLTGYYEPLVKGSRTPDAAFRTPVYRRPSDLVNVVAESERGAKSPQFTHMRQTAQGLQPHFTRAEIDQGALKGQNLELLYFKDPVDVFFMQVQGSARIELPSGEQIRITYDAKNGYPYTSIGKALVDLGSIRPDNMSMQSLSAWLKADPERAKPIMWKNEFMCFSRTRGRGSRRADGGSQDSAAGRAQPRRRYRISRDRNADVCVGSRHHTCRPKHGGWRFQPSDDRARCRLCDQGPRTGRYLFRFRRESGALGGRHQASGPIFRASAARRRRCARANRQSAVKRSGGRKPLGGDDARVWSHAAQNIKPLKLKKSRVHPAVDGNADETPASPRKAEALPAPRPPIAPAKQPPARPPQSASPKPASIAVVDRKTARKIRSGQVEIEARVDLHGMRQDEAHDALIAFLRRSRSRGLRWVLVITGKGRSGEIDGERPFEMPSRDRGVLKRNVPRWLSEPELRAMVVSYTEAAIRHGGEGALYVHLRK